MVRFDPYDGGPYVKLFPTNSTATVCLELSYKSEQLRNIKGEEKENPLMMLPPKPGGGKNGDHNAGKHSDAVTPPSSRASDELRIGIDSSG